MREASEVPQTPKNPIETGVPLVTLPDSKTMQERLLTVSNNADLVKEFYSILLVAGGKVCRPEDVVKKLTYAMHACTGKISPTSSMVLETHTDNFIDALVSDPTAAAEVKRRFKEAGKSTKGYHAQEGSGGLGHMH